MAQLLQQLNWLSVNEILQFRDSVMAYKCANNLAPDYLCIKFNKRSPVHDPATRNNNKLQIPLYKTFSGQRTFAYRAVSLWNSLVHKKKIHSDGKPLWIIVYKKIHSDGKPLWIIVYKKFTVIGNLCELQYIKKIHSDGKPLWIIVYKKNSQWWETFVNYSI